MSPVMFDNSKYTLDKENNIECNFGSRVVKDLTRLLVGNLISICRISYCFRDFSEEN